MTTESVLLIIGLALLCLILIAWALSGWLRARGRSSDATPAMPPLPRPTPQAREFYPGTHVSRSRNERSGRYEEHRSPADDSSSSAFSFSPPPSYDPPAQTYTPPAEPDWSGGGGRSGGAGASGSWDEPDRSGSGSGGYSGSSESGGSSSSDSGSSSYSSSDSGGSSGSGGSGD